MRVLGYLSISAVLSLAAVALLVGCNGATKSVDLAAIEQAKCPVMGGVINKDLYVDHDGKRVYVCCPGCIDTVKADPETYISKLEAEGVTLAETPALCAKCGDFKGSDECCVLEGRTLCPKCGLLKGSPGCCKLPAAK